MTLIKTSFFSAVITFIRLISGFVVGKIIAVVTGPPGVALVGQFSNFMTIFLNLANGAINNGVIKFTAQYEENIEQQKKLFSTALKISIYCSCITGLLLLIFSNFFSFLIFKDYNRAFIIKTFGITIIFYSLNSLLIAILNGKKDIKKYTIVNTTGSICSLLLTAYLVYYYKTDGALLALVLSQALVFFVTLFLIIKSSWFQLSYFRLPFNFKVAKELSHFSLMSLVSIVTLPLSQILVRNILIQKIDVNAAGYWQGMMKISDGYLLIISTALSTYYLPKLSSIKQNNELKTEIFNGFKIIMPAVITGCIVIYILRYFIIDTLYTKDFIVMESLFIWQLTGDVLKTATYLFGFIMIAKSMTMYYIVTEIVFSFCYVLLAQICIKHYQLPGVTMAFALNYFLCLIYMIFIFRKLIFKHEA